MDTLGEDVRRSFEFEYDQRELDLSVQVIEAIAEATDSDALSLEPPLHDIVDPDALDSLFRHGTAGMVRFSYDVHLVTIERDRSGSGQITVVPDYY